jgi:hypothetical protein
LVGNIDVKGREILGRSKRYMRVSDKLRGEISLTHLGNRACTSFTNIPDILFLPHRMLWQVDTEECATRHWGSDFERGSSWLLSL